ncbi:MULTISPECIES: hypothetical protein [Brachybacterium]|uniref:Uncharacterized protein n=2 Tax=Brachybacterium TaxID=43668 RepID=A0A3R8RNM2_9MICO|nr:MULTISPECIES: hypothetical protein [Brachybacterium]MCT1436763.1 hypothetical protein [Brachybacterium paraconglomeratum]RRR17910.1 hypothetical protein DS079_11500 [Brachybacterium paraconglomeratum]GLI29341.1 hypothetical protein BCONGLO52_01820 [Brachybacterium conglomeratum]GLK05671.1 hypothetical protein GCM10017597_24710 [Brachybacterium conglomeratum]
MHRTSGRPSAPAAHARRRRERGGAEGLGIITLRALPGPYEIETPRRDGRLDPVPARMNVLPLLSHWTPVPLLAGYATGAQDRDGELVTTPNA